MKNKQKKGYLELHNQYVQAFQRFSTTMIIFAILSFVSMIIGLINSPSNYDMSLGVGIIFFRAIEFYQPGVLVEVLSIILVGGVLSALCLVLGLYIKKVNKELMYLAMIFLFVNLVLYLVYVFSPFGLMIGNTIQSIIITVFTHLVGVAFCCLTLYYYYAVLELEKRKNSLYEKK